MEDRTETGRKLRILTVVDEFTRQCVEIEVESRMNARFVASTLLRLFGERGTPRFIRSDNGPEFIAKSLMRALSDMGVEARHIEPGSPWQNGVNERFNGTLRDECLNMETFHGPDHARAVCKIFKRHYNSSRPHSSLENLTPEEFAARCSTGIQGDTATKTGLCPEPRDLSHGTPPVGVEEEKSRSTEGLDRPANRQAVHDGARVASQRCPILRVDASNIQNHESAGKVPAQDRGHPHEVLYIPVVPEMGS